MINCSVTIMPMFQESIGFVRRDKDDDKFPGLLVVPGGKIEDSDAGEYIDGVPYFTAEAAAVRELYEETGIQIDYQKLWYFCSLTLQSSGRIVISYWVDLEDVIPNLIEHEFKGIIPGILTSPSGHITEFLTRSQVKLMETEEFCPGMQLEALLLFEQQGIF